MNVQTEIAPPGSSLYYSLLRCDPLLRQRIIALRGFYQAIRDIPLKCQNTELAQIKFQWWREELTRHKTQTAQHPVMKLLPADFDRHADLEIILNTFSEDMKISLYENNADLDTFYLNSAGLLETVLYNISDQTLLNQLSNMGIFIQKISHLRELRSAISHGKTYFSGEQLLLHRVNLYELSQLKPIDTIQALFKDQAEKICADYHRHPGQLSLLPKPTLILSNIYKQLLNEIIQSNFPLLTHKMTLTPLRKWWIAWKS